MTKSDFNLLYTDLNKLLEDIREFLSDCLEKGQLSGHAKENASVLIERSKDQLVAIAKVAPSDGDSSRYVDMMSGKETIAEYLEPQAIYSPVEETVEEEDTKVASNPSIASEETVICPYENLPASEASIEKYGYLEKREKFVILYNRKVYVAIYDSWLLTYATDKDLKPIEVLPLNLYEAKEVPTPKERSFEITKPGEPMGKAIFFTAYSKKDMIQWVSSINKKKAPDPSQSSFPRFVNTPSNNTLPTMSKPMSRTPNSSLPRTPRDALPQKPPTSLPDIELEVNPEDEDIYDTIVEVAPRKDSTPQKEPSSPSKLKPILPPRVPNGNSREGSQKSLRPVHHIPASADDEEDDEDDEDEEEYDEEEYDEIGNGDESFSSDDEDNIYDTVVNTHLSGHNPLGQQSLGQHPPGQHSSGQHPPGQHGLGQHPPGQHAPGQHAPGKHPPGQHPPGKHAPSQHPSGQHPPGQLTSDQQPPGPHPSGQHTPGQHTPGKHTPGKHRSGQHPPGKYSPGQHPPSQHQPGYLPSLSLNSLPRHPVPPNSLPLNPVAPNALALNLIPPNSSPLAHNHPDNEDVEYDWVQNDPLPPPPPEVLKEPSPPKNKRDSAGQGSIAEIKPKPVIKPKTFPQKRTNPQSPHISSPVIHRTSSTSSAYRTSMLSKQGTTKPNPKTSNTASPAPTSSNPIPPPPPRNGSKPAQDDPPPIQLNPVKVNSFVHQFNRKNRNS